MSYPAGVNPALVALLDGNPMATVELMWDGDLDSRSHSLFCWRSEGPPSALLLWRTAGRMAVADRHPMVKVGDAEPLSPFTDMASAEAASELVYVV